MPPASPGTCFNLTLPALTGTPEPVPLFLCSHLLSQQLSAYAQATTVSSPHILPPKK